MKNLIPALAILALANVGCGGGGSSDSAPAPAPQATTAQTAPASTQAPAATAQTAPAATTQTAPAAGGAPSAAQVAEAEKIYTTRCTPCHGTAGAGDGAAAAALNPKPRNYSDKAWQAATKDEEIAKAIVGGGTSVGLSALMPPNPDLADKPMVVQALVSKIRSFAK